MNREDILRERIAKATSLQDLERLLAGVLSDGFFRSTRQRVDAIGPITIEVFPRDHNPPHFHVKGPGINVRIGIADCRPLAGQRPLCRTDQIEIASWFFEKGGGAAVLAAWNKRYASGSGPSV